MLFSSMMFIWIFLPLVFIGNIILHKVGGNKLANVLLLVASIFFYAWGEPVYVILMLISITVNWSAGLFLNRCIKYRKIILICNVIVNLGILGYFKYAGMFVETINALTGSMFPLPQIALPIGISFFTFQALSYVIDVYRGECSTQKSWLNLALYVSFFPQLIAGPIVQYKDVNEQIDHRTIDIVKMASGIRRFIYGFAKKILFANTFALCADRLYALELTDVTWIMAWIASIAYMLQIYYDFSGYSDMAIGLGRMFGFEFKENFNYPYLSHSIHEFWRRWHISLGAWFREYVYIPLGGNRKGSVRTYLNLFSVFFLTGIWHGASWSFVFWGLYHGMFNIIERLGFGKILKKSKAFSFIYTILVVNFGWVFFRIEKIGDASKYIYKMLIPWNNVNSIYSIWEYMDIHLLVMIILGIFGAGFLKYLGEKMDIARKWKYSCVEMIYCIIIFILSIMRLASNTYNPFIYFRF